MTGKCPSCEIRFVWTPGAPDPLFGELFPAPSRMGRAYCPDCRRHLWKTDRRWTKYPIQHRNPIQGPEVEEAVHRFGGCPLRIPTEGLKPYKEYSPFIPKLL